MKRILLFLIIAIMLAGCGQKVHKNISQEMADDTEQIIKIFDSVFEENRDLTSKEERAFEQYKKKYAVLQETNDLESGKLTREERTLYTFTELLLIDSYKLLKDDDEGKYEYKDRKEQIFKIMETGEI